MVLITSKVNTVCISGCFDFLSDQTMVETFTTTATVFGGWNQAFLGNGLDVLFFDVLRFTNVSSVSNLQYDSFPCLRIS